MKKHTCQLLQIFILACCLSFTTNAATVAPHLVDTGVVFGEGISFSGNTVLYAKDRWLAMGKAINPDDLSDQQYLIDSSTGAPWVQTQYNHYDIYMTPGVGGYVAFSGSWERMFYRKVTSDFIVGPPELIQHESYHNWVPLLYENTMIWWWAPGPNTHFDVKVLNLITGERTTLAGGPGAQVCWDIWGEYAFYSDDNRPFYKNLSGLEPAVAIIAEDGETLDRAGSIQNGRIILWSGEYRKIYLYVIGKDTVARKILEASNFNMATPYLFGDLLVWSDNRNGSFDIYGLNISQDGASPVRITTNDSTDEKMPLLYNDILIWMEGGKGFTSRTPADLYAAKVTSVFDTTKPVAVCRDITVQLDANGWAVINTSDIDNGSYDDQAIKSMDISLNSFTCENVGSGNRVVLTVTDTSGNTAECSSIVTVVDNVPPTLKTTCGEIVLDVDNACLAQIPDVLSGIQTTDNCDAVTLSQNPLAGTSVGLGQHLVTITGIDGSGNRGTCVQSVTIRDTTPPTIICPPDIYLDSDPALLVPADFSASVIDNCDVQPTVEYSHMPGSGFPIGTTEVECTATDSSGNSSQCKFKVNRSTLGFSGFLPPIGGADETGGSFSAPLRTFKLNSTIPVKMGITSKGTPVLVGVHRLQVIKYSDLTTADTPIDATPQDAATSGNQFRLVDGQWHFNLDTKGTGMTPGIWLVQAVLSDGSTHQAWIQIK